MSTEEDLIAELQKAIDQANQGLTVSGKEIFERLKREREEEDDEDDNL